MLLSLPVLADGSDEVSTTSWGVYGWPSTKTFDMVFPLTVMVPSSLTSTPGMLGMSSISDFWSSWLFAGTAISMSS